MLIFVSNVFYDKIVWVFYLFISCLIIGCDMLQIIKFIVEISEMVFLFIENCCFYGFINVLNDRCIFWIVNKIKKVMDMMI